MEWYFHNFFQLSDLRGKKLSLLQSLYPLKDTPKLGDKFGYYFMQRSCTHDVKLHNLRHYARSLKFTELIYVKISSRVCKFTLRKITQKMSIKIVFVSGMYRSRVKNIQDIDPQLQLEFVPRTDMAYLPFGSRHFLESTLLRTTFKKQNNSDKNLYF